VSWEPTASSPELETNVCNEKGKGRRAFIDPFPVAQKWKIDPKWKHQQKEDGKESLTKKRQKKKNNRMNEEKRGGKKKKIGLCPWVYLWLIGTKRGM